MAIDIREHPLFQDGVEEGRAAGKAEGKAELLIDLLGRRLGQLGRDRQVAISSLGEAQLDTLASRILTLTTMAELDEYLRQP